MKRRKALHNMSLITGGFYLLSSCDFNNDDVILAYENLKVSETQKQLVATIAEVIIPAGTLKGALALEVQDFILLMVNDCFNREDQKKFILGLNEFNSYSKTRAGKLFEKLTRDQKEDLIQAGIDATRKKNTDKDNPYDLKEKAVHYFLKLCKQLTIQGFMTSEYIQNRILSLSLIPGSYDGAVLISDKHKKRING